MRIERKLATLYASGAESAENRIRLGRKYVPVCPSARSGNPSPISGLHSGNCPALSDWESAAFVAKLKCHASLLPKSGVTISCNMGKNNLKKNIPTIQHNMEMAMISARRVRMDDFRGAGCLSIIS